MTIALLVTLTLLIAHGLSADTFTAEAAPELDRLFQNTNGWIGADGSYSADLGHGRVAWLFSDTFVGKVSDGKRVDCTMINNSVAIQPGIRRRPVFYYGSDASGKPQSFVKPIEGKGHYWLFASGMSDEGLVVFLSQIELTGAGGAFGFKGVGCKLGIVQNPEDSPSDWKWTQTDIPHQSYSGDITGHFGAAVLTEGEYLYAYGFRKDGADSKPQATLARIPRRSPADFATWRFYSHGKWVTDWTKASSLFAEPASEYSVSWLPSIGKYCAVYMSGIWGRMMVRTAPRPEGPWSEPHEVFVCPEMDWDKQYFCYAAKAHPELAIDDDELIVTYACNSFDFSKLISDARIYWPRFVRIKAATESTPGK